MDLALEKIDYCQMNPSATAEPDNPDTHLEHEDDNDYTNVSKLRKNLGRSKLLDYASLRRSKMEERQYTNIKTNQNREAQDAEKVQLKKMKMLMHAMYCVAGYVTVTFLITGALLTYTIWTMADLRYDQRECCADLSNSVAKIRKSASTLQSNVSHLYGDYASIHATVNELEKGASRLSKKIDSTCESTLCIITCHLYNPQSTECVPVSII